MRYGLPYQGSKNQIARKIIAELPAGKRLVDLFGGGGAISHCAALSGKWESVYYNDFNPLVVDFLRRAVNGDFSPDRFTPEWVSREDFQRLKDKDGYIKYVWSFGSAGVNYLYSKEVEPWKKAVHYARVFKDLSLLRKFGIDSDGSRGDIERNHAGYKELYVRWYMREVLKYTGDIEKLKCNIEIQKEELRQWLRDVLKRSGKTAADINRHLGTNGMAGHYFGKSQWGFPTRENYNKMAEIMPFGKSFEEVYGYTQLCESLQRLQSLESLQRLQSLESLQSLPVEIHCGSYLDYEYQDGDIVYCDIPYEGTKGYDDKEFNHEQFYDWEYSRPYQVFFSSYDNISDKRFKSVYQTDKHSLFSGSGNSTIKKETLYVNFETGPETKEFKAVPYGDCWQYVMF